MRDVYLCSAPVTIDNTILLYCDQHLQEKLGPDAVGWVEMFDPPLITSDKRHYLLRLPMNDPDSGAFRQIAMITINVSTAREGEKKRSPTSGS